MPEFKVSKPKTTCVRACVSETKALARKLAELSAMLQRHTDSLSHASFDDSDSHDVQHEHEACSKDAMMSLLIAADYIKDLQQVVTDRDCSDNESSQEEDQNETDHKPGDESEENENGDGEDEDGAKEEGESPSDTPSV